MTEQITIEQSIGKKTLAERIREYRKADNINIDETEDLTIEYIQKPKITKPKKPRKIKEPMSMERYYAEFTPDKLKTIDTWTTDKYLQYYSNVLHQIKSFMNPPDGYKPIAIENNIPFLLETSQITRTCKCKYHNEPHTKYLLPVGTNKLSMFWCEHDPVFEGSSIFNRYKVYGKVLWSIDDIIKKPNLIKTMRSLYYHSAIRYNEYKPLFWTKRWNEISAFNAVVDIDITDKHRADIYQKEDKWGHSRYDMSFEMLSKISQSLTNIGIKHKIRSSGNGWYFEFEKIIITEHNIPKYDNIYADKDEEIITNNNDGTTDIKIVKKEDAFWNRVANTIKEIKDNTIRPIVEEYHKYFTVDIDRPYPNKLYKGPYSLHQRLDYIAKPTNLDEINDNTSKEFQDLCSPDHVFNNTIEYWKEWR